MRLAHINCGMPVVPVAKQVFSQQGNMLVPVGAVDIPHCSECKIPLDWRKDITIMMMGGKV